MPEAARLGIPPEQFAAESGEEFELLVALPATFDLEDARAFASVASVGLTRVGDVQPGSGVRATLAGTAIALAGFDHFAPRRR